MAVTDDAVVMEKEFHAFVGRTCTEDGYAESAEFITGYLFGGSVAGDPVLLRMMITIRCIPAAEQTGPLTGFSCIPEERVFLQIFRIGSQSGAPELAPDPAYHVGIGHAAFGADPVMEILIVKKIFHDFEKTAVKIAVLQDDPEAVEGGDIHADGIVHAMFGPVCPEQQTAFIKQIFQNIFFPSVPGFRRFQHHVSMSQIVEINRFGRSPEHRQCGSQPGRTIPAVIAGFVFFDLFLKLRKRLRFEVEMTAPRIGRQNFRKRFQDGNGTDRILFIAGGVIGFRQIADNAAAPGAAAQCVDPFVRQIIFRIGFQFSADTSGFDFRGQMIFAFVFFTGIIHQRVFSMNWKGHQIFSRMCAIDPVRIIDRIIFEPCSECSAERTALYLTRDIRIDFGQDRTGRFGRDQCSQLFRCFFQIRGSFFYDSRIE